MLFDSITTQLFSLADEISIYPGHDYHGRWMSSVVQEQATNPRLAGKSRDEFIEIMNHLALPKPVHLSI